ncbi:MAG: hypothetical protein K2P85_01845 [Flavobacteriaceae bacterium]|nr:hypothetical protein [Flavobacteriaceae bacterium]
MTKNLNELYFIRLSDNKESFVHIENTFKFMEANYVVKHSKIGACIWEKEKAEMFIKEAGADNLEMVKASELLLD